MNEKTIIFTKEEIEKLIEGCKTIISDYCISDDEEKPYIDLVDKLRGCTEDGWKIVGIRGKI